MGEATRRRWAWACFAAAGAGLAALVGMVLSPGDAPGAGSGGERSTESVAHFSVGGDGDRPISPGMTIPLDLEIDNPHDEPLTVTRLLVTLRVADAPEADTQHPCSAADFTVVQASEALPIRLPARQTSSLRGLDLPESQWPRIGMLNRGVNQDGCKGSTLALDYSATGQVGG